MVTARPRVAGVRAEVRDGLAAALATWFAGYGRVDTAAVEADQEDLVALRSPGYID